MFQHCNNILEKISVIVTTIGIFVLQFAGAYFLAQTLHLGDIGIIIGQIIVVCCLITWEKIYKRKIIYEYQYSLDYEKRKNEYFEENKLI